MSARLSPLDTARWGCVSAAASDVTPDTLARVLSFCRENAVRFLIARCSTGDLAAAQAMEEGGFRLMDTLVYFARELAAVPSEGAALPVRAVRPGEDAVVAEVASRAFAGYYGHYHADPRLDRRQCDEVYVDWARRSCVSLEVADGVLVCEVEGRIAAFATLRLNSDIEGEGVLFGVAPEAQGRGIYRALMLGGMAWCLGRGRKRMVVSTQVTNQAVQKVWTRLGFEPSKSYYTFHKWFT